MTTKIKNYFKEINTKTTWYEKAFFGLVLTAMLLFCFMTLDKDGHAHLAEAWRGQSFLGNPGNNFMFEETKALGIIGQLLITVGTVSALFASLNRFLRFKQEIPLALIANIGIGLGLFLTGIKTDGILNLIVYGSVTLSAFPIWFNATTKGNEVKVRNGWDWKMAALAFSLFIGLLPIIMVVWSQLGNHPLGYDASSIETVFKTWQPLLLDAVATALCVVAVVLMTVFKWSYSFIIFGAANIILMVIYQVHWNGSSFEHSAWNVPLFILMFFYTAMDAYIAVKWIKNKK